MGRHRSIDRDKVLDAAEAIIDEVGPGGLTIDAVAKAAGITKGGVQYCFGSKDQLIDALFDRRAKECDAQFTGFFGQNNDPVTFIRQYAAMAQKCEYAQVAKSAAMMATLMRSAERMEQTRGWYRNKLEKFDSSTEVGQIARIIFMAIEGAYVLRCFGFMTLCDEEWRTFVHTIASLLPQVVVHNKNN